MDTFVFWVVVGIAVIAVIVINRNNRIERDKLIVIHCPRCGYESTKDKFGKGSSDIIGCFLLLLFIVPAIFYYAMFGSKVVCPKCSARF